MTSSEIVTIGLLAPICPSSCPPTEAEVIGIRRAVLWVPACRGNRAVNLSFVTLIPVEPERAFDLSIDIGTHLESMAESGERAVDGVTSGLIALGESVTWKARHFGVTWKMTSTITEWDRPHCFVDEQTRGPFASFHHVHRFAPAAGGTEMSDEINYTAPFGYLGEMLDWLILRRHLRKLIDVRNQFIVAEALRSAITDEQFDFLFSPQVQRWNRLFGIGPRSSGVRISGDELTARFGPWVVRTDRSNVIEVMTTGPYKTWRVAGPARLSLADRGLTFGSNTDVGLCIGFRSPIRGLDPFGILHHPTLTVTVADPAGLVRALGFGDCPRHVDLTHGSFLGAARAVRRWATRKRSVEVTPPEPVAKVDIPGGVAVSDAQEIASGVGPLFHRLYRVEVSEATMSAQQVLEAIRADPNVIADPRLAPFVKNVGEPGVMALGDRYTVETAGPWSGPVEVVQSEPDHFRLATLQGHMEAGLVEMRARTHDHLLVFEIESWARSGDRAFHVIYDKVGVAKAMQSEMWVSACEAVVRMSEGRQVGPVAIIEEEVQLPQE
jgi:ligand-binding SRPBCC domain-containing protein